MLAAFLLAGLVAAPLATLALFTRTDAPRPVRAGALVVRPPAPAVGGRLRRPRGGRRGRPVPPRRHAARTSSPGSSGLLVVSALWLPATRQWSARAHLRWAATFYLFAAYLVFMLWWTFVSHLGRLGTIGALLLWLMEVFAAFLGVAYLWELCDALGREPWLRRVPTGRRRSTRDAHCRSSACTCRRTTSRRRW